MTPSRADRSPSLYWPLACAWLLGLLCFQLPGRDAPETVGSVDAIALMKIGVRLLAIIVLGITLVRAWHLPRRQVVVVCLAPYALFVAWAIVSAAWSPLKAVSLGQASGLVAQLLLTACIAMLWRGPADTSRILFHLCLAMILFSAVLVVIDYAWHEGSGLNRENWDELEDTASGFVHPTTAGATASLGLLLLLGSFACGGWRWTRVLLVPGGFALSLLLLLSQSRMAILMAGCVLPTLFIVRARPVAIAAVTLAMCLTATGLLIVDPGFESSEEIAFRATGLMQRGESLEQLASFTGRTELWDAIWQEYLKSPVVGHGYFVTSSQGELDVWQGPANRSAHNIVLQVLVSTGMVGLLLFAAGIALPIWLAARSLLSSPQAERRTEGIHGSRPFDVAILLSLVVLWFAGWGQLSESFMGPVQPESVVFYSLLGLAVAHVRLSPLPSTTHVISRSTRITGATP